MCSKKNIPFCFLTYWEKTLRKINNLNAVLACNCNNALRGKKTTLIADGHGNIALNITKQQRLTKLYKNFNGHCEM